LAAAALDWMRRRFPRGIRLVALGTQQNFLISWRFSSGIISPFSPRRLAISA
jgi:hypothetical protein